MLGFERGMKSRSEVTIGSLEKRNAYGNIKSALSICELHAKLYLYGERSTDHFISNGELFVSIENIVVVIVE